MTGTSLSTSVLATSPLRPARRTVLSVVALALVVIVFALLSDRYFTAANVVNVLRQVAIVVSVGSVFTLLLVAGGIDLSIGGVLALGGLVAVLLLNNGVAWPIAFVVAGLIGGLVGVVNGLLVAYVGINTVIATLASLYVTTGAVEVLTGGKSVVAKVDGFPFIGNGNLGPIPVLIVAMAAVLTLAFLVERRTLVGRYIVLIGTNPTAARLSGVPVRRTQLALFVASGVVAALAGIAVASRSNAATTAAGAGFEFDVIIATVVGGTSVLGGEGSVVGTLLGALIVGAASTGLNIVGVPSFVQTVLLGLLLIGAVSMDALARRRDAR